MTMNIHICIRIYRPLCYVDRYIDIDSDVVIFITIIGFQLPSLKKHWPLF